ncbi:PREDICTED: translation initiation factor eIF-2B subunit delta-like [Priapulus caudatus]|uniref:Translation initiation factor eIF2B subunit delta n=1 Tax=Priapulus caudatus TaxID=37621 RepID=A0ABM1DV59_PRICU|nr:PREDICTED: translation initiation factor eIF-2B subunit delta-like [Priapulus caudatus]XP_014663830.1 PREDICTED: translation initiation factor eIF-2B subunit delta-like [Priapulus caudatus]
MDHQHVTPQTQKTTKKKNKKKSPKGVQQQQQQCSDSQVVHDSECSEPQATQGQYVTSKEQPDHDIIRQVPEQQQPAAKGNKDQSQSAENTGQSNKNPTTPPADDPANKEALQQSRAQKKLRKQQRKAGGGQTEGTQQQQLGQQQQHNTQSHGHGKSDHHAKSQGNLVANIDTPVVQKSKVELKAERRAKQEAQRAAKSAEQGKGGKKGDVGMLAGSAAVPKRVPDQVRADEEKVQKKLARKLEKQQVPQRISAQKKVKLFMHLHQYEKTTSPTQGILINGSMHPAMLRLGLQYAEGFIQGSNARCIALLYALKQVFSDYSTPPHKELARELDAKIKPYITFLNQCRPLSVSMGNAIKYLKMLITNMPPELSDDEAKKKLNKAIDTYYLEKIQLAGTAISNFAIQKITDGDVILVYACSSLIQKVLCAAKDKNKRFQVIVVDSRPKLEGKEMLRRLVKHGITCSYVLINAISYIMPEVSKVILGAHALLANGYVMSRCGSSQITLMAKSYNVPVLVCCETYKFCERVQTDSFVSNELGDPDDLVRIDYNKAPLADWREKKYLSLLNLVYDVTPPDFVNVVITEVGMIPCTSVPVVLRVKNVEAN